MNDVPIMIFSSNFYIKFETIFNKPIYKRKMKVDARSILRFNNLLIVNYTLNESVLKTYRIQTKKKELH